MNTQTLNLIISFIATVILGAIVVPKLRKLKVGQIVREDGPKSHLKKSGTPVMGGIVMIIVVTIILAVNLVNYRELIIPIVAIFGCGIIGFIDDYKKLVKKNTEGLSPKKKIFGLLIVTALVIVLYLKAFNFGTEIIVPFVNQPLYLSPLVFVIFTAFVFIGTTNAVNLTDGLDGLAGGLSVVAIMAYGVIAWGSKWISGYQEIAIFAFVLCGAILGFLVFNTHPAKVFMGDTGSLALGGALATIAILTKHELSLLLIGGVFVVETLSSAIQIIAIRKFHKKVFLKAPLHHHFEELGWEETDIVKLFWVVGLFLAMIGIIYGVWL